MKAKILTNKGTLGSVVEVKPAVWSGKEFVEYSLKKTASLSAKAKIITQHGTSSVKAGEYPKYSRIIPKSGIKISSGKGTRTIQL